MLRVDEVVELWFEFLQSSAAGEQEGLDEPAQEENGQAQVEER